MQNVLSLRIAEALSFAKPMGLPPDIYADQLCYGALAEWLRTICCDVDPAMGNNRLGVTRTYLETRGSQVLNRLTEGLLERRFSEAEIEAQVSWMVEALIEISEIWTPDKSIVSCKMTGITDFWRDTGRLLGHSSGIPVPYRQIGLCRYTTQKIDQDTKKALECQKAEAEELLKRYGVEYYLPLSMDQMESEVKANAKSAGAYLVITEDLGSCSQKVRKFLLMTAWPMNNDLLTWNRTRQWMMPA